MAQAPRHPQVDGRRIKTNFKLEGGVHKVELEAPLSAERVSEIEGCLKKGRLDITVTSIDLGEGRLEESWLYD
jgi:hypothetical protein